MERAENDFALKQQYDENDFGYDYWIDDTPELVPDMMCAGMVAPGGVIDSPPFCFCCVYRSCRARPRQLENVPHFYRSARNMLSASLLFVLENVLENPINLFRRKQFRLCINCSRLLQICLDAGPQRALKRGL